MRTRTNRPSRTAVMAAVALVGSLLVMVPGPVGAVEGEADEPAQYSACVGAATESAGFVDMVDVFAEEEVNCLAHYEIAKGTSDTMFSPNAAITRLQMALFLSRAAGPAGITLPSARDQGFVDIGNMTAEIRDAINRMASLDIMEGRTGTEFRPTELVTRADMAEHLAAFLEEAEVGPGGIDIEDVDSDDEDVFEDIERVSRRTYDAILNLYEMGITQGTSRDSFTPTGAVTRAQMAAFITRTLAHTNARPAGLTVQVVGGETSVFEGRSIELVASVRDRNRRPMEDAYVDIFWGDSEARALDSSGECVAGRTFLLDFGGSDTCVIDSGDPFTDVDGNLEDLPTIDGTDVEEDLVIWAWTGDVGDSFDDDRSNPVKIEISVANAADQTRLTHNAGVAKTVKYGKRVTFTFQLVDDNGVRIRQPDAKVTVRATVAEFNGHDADDTDDTSGRIDLDVDTDTHETNSSGRFELSYTQRDPRRGTDNVTLVKLEFLNPDYEVVEDDGGTIEEILITWSDAPSGGRNVFLEQTSAYSVASSRARNTITVTLADQYGSPIRGEVTFVSDDTESDLIGSASKRVSSQGRTTFRYERDTTDHGKETITVTYDDDTSVTKDIIHYWGARPDHGDDIDGTVVYVDKADNVIVVEESGSFHIVKYRSSDQFYVGGTASLFARFEACLSEDDTIGSDSEYGDSVSTIRLTDDDDSCPS